MGTLTMPQSGPIYMPSGVSSAEEWWTLLRRDSHALRSQLLGGGEEQQTHATSGPKPSESYGKWDPAMCCWRTYQVYCPLDGNSTAPVTQEKLSGSFPSGGMTVSGELYRLPKQGPPTSVNGGGVWVSTPTTIQRVRTGRYIVGRTLTAAEMAKTGKWPPTTSANGGGVLPTPQTTDAPKGGGPPNKRANTKRWGGVNSLGQMAKTGKWPTPRANSAMAGTITEAADPNRGYLEAEMKKRYSDVVGSQLNPDWVELLMGLPLGWTSTEALPRERYAEWEEVGGRPWMGDWEKGVPRVATGIPHRVHRLKAIGNGIVPAVVAEFLGLLWKA